MPTKANKCIKRRSKRGILEKNNKRLLDRKRKRVKMCGLVKITRT